MIDRQTIDDQHWVERYFADRLTDDERAQFEAYMLEHPEVVVEMASTARFISGLAGLQRTGELQSLLGASTSAPLPAARRWRMPVAIAATVLLTVTVLVVTRFGERPAAVPVLAETRTAMTDDAGKELPIVDSYEILRVRGDTYDSVIQLPSAPGVLEIRVAPEFDALRYRVRLTAVTEPQLAAEVSGLRAVTDGSLLLYLNPGLVHPGPYLLQIYPDADGGDARQSSFRLNVSAAK